MRLVQPLFDGPLDVVGDVHGEIDALRSLLSHLGYSHDGREHPNHRRLVFVGDLCWKPRTDLSDSARPSLPGLT